MESDSLLAVFGFFSFGFAALILLLYFKDWVQSFYRRLPTRSPLTPKWLKPIVKTQSSVGINAGIRIYCRTYHCQRNDTPTAIYKVQLIIDDVCERLELERITIPQTACEIQIPARNFRVWTNASCNFKPLECSRTSESFFTWQMFGNNAIQVCFYHENNQKYLAGFSIYIESPYDYGVKFRQSIIREWLEMPHYYPPNPREELKLCWCVIDEQPVVITENGVGSVKRHEITIDGFKCLKWNQDVRMPIHPKDPKKEVKKVLVKMCNGTPVMVGWNKNGKTIHLDWKNGKWIILKECSKCTEEVEAPPKYSTLKIFDDLLS